MIALLSSPHTSFDITRAFVANHDSRTKKMTDKATFGTKVSISFHVERPVLGSAVGGPEFQSVTMTLFSNNNRIDGVEFCTLLNDSTRRYDIQCQFPKIIMKFTYDSSTMTVRIISIEVRNDSNFERILRLFEGLNMRYRPLIVTKGQQVLRESTASPFGNQSPNHMHMTYRNSHTASPIPPSFYSQSNDMGYDHTFSPTTTQSYWTGSPARSSLQDAGISQVDRNYSIDYSHLIDPSLTPSKTNDQPMIPPPNLDYQRQAVPGFSTSPNHGPSPLSQVRVNHIVDALSAASQPSTPVPLRVGGENADFLPPTRTLPFQALNQQRQVSDKTQSASDDDPDEIEEPVESPKALVGVKKAHAKKSSPKKAQTKTTTKAITSNSTVTNPKSKPSSHKRPAEEPTSTASSSKKSKANIPPKKSHKAAPKPSASQASILVPPAKASALTRTARKEEINKKGTSTAKFQVNPMENIDAENSTIELAVQNSTKEVNVIMQKKGHSTKVMTGLIMSPSVMLSTIERRAPWLLGTRKW